MIRCVLLHAESWQRFGFLCAGWALSAAAAADPPGARDDSPVGTCVERYRIPKPDPDASVAVKVEKNSDARGNRYVWTWDTTPASNPTRVLVRVTPRRLGCTILFLPNADYHDFRLAPRGALPAKVTAYSAVLNDGDGGRQFAYEYGLDRSSGLYAKLPRCFAMRADGTDRKEVPCQEALGP